MTLHWDPAAACYSSNANAYEALIALPIIALAFYLHWRSLKWLAARKWRGLRYWLPVTAMLGVCIPWSMFGGRILSEEVTIAYCICGGSLLSAPTAAVYLFANWPPMIGAGFVAVILGRPESWPAHAAVAIGSWLTWYLLVVWVESNASSRR